MSQSRLQSMREVVDRTVFNYAVATVMGFLLWYPLFNVDINLGETMGLGIVFTLQGMLVSYYVRRYRASKGE